MLQESKETVESIARDDERNALKVRQERVTHPPKATEIAPKRQLAPVIIIISTMAAAAVLIGIFVNAIVGVLIGIACVVYTFINPAVRAALAGENRGSGAEVRTRPEREVKY